MGNEEVSRYFVRPFFAILSKVAWWSHEQQHKVYKSDVKRGKTPGPPESIYSPPPPPLINICECPHSIPNGSGCAHPLKCVMKLQWTRQHTKTPLSLQAAYTNIGVSQNPLLMSSNRGPTVSNFKGLAWKMTSSMQKCQFSVNYAYI